MSRKHGGSKNADRQKCLDLRHNSALAFASTDNLIEACRLAVGDHKLRQILLNAGDWLEPDACLTFIQLFALAFTGKRPNADRAWAFIAQAVDDWCQNQERAVRFFGLMLDGVSLDLPPTGSTCASSYLAIWMAKHHNPNMYHQDGVLPPTRILMLIFGAAYAGNEQAKMVLRDYWQIMDHYGNMPTSNPLQPGSTKTPWQQPTKTMKPFAESMIRMLLKLAQESGLEEAEVLLARKRQEADSAIDSLWKEVVDKARCDVRSTGEDVFHLQGPLDKLGCGYRYFVRNEHTFPVVGVAILAQFERCKVWLMSEIGPDRRPDGDSTRLYLSHLGGLLAYHKLVCQEPADVDFAANNHPDKIEQIVGLPYGVRSHDRVLPEGRGPSADAIKAYRERWPGRDKPPDGKTFVREHERVHRPTYRRLRRMPPELPKPMVTVDVIKTINDL